uniref:B30.2/SPRY domain-containing protein n=1 Tax=Eptatretus burgeri TaxID=7764 RepID=A0A8C4QWP7_EPTBU
MCKYACSLDQNSANPRIMISQDLSRATLTRTNQPYPKHPHRFDVYHQVVSSESFSSGRHYWEVDVSSSHWCRIGVCLNSMGRKGKGNECWLGGNPESWCLQKRDNKYTTCHNMQGTFLSVPGDPKRVGFFLDCEAGELRCFGDSGVLHVFRGNFMVPVKPAIGFYYYADDTVRFCSL